MNGTSCDGREMAVNTKTGVLRGNESDLYPRERIYAVARGERRKNGWVALLRLTRTARPASSTGGAWERALLGLRRICGADEAKWRRELHPGAHERRCRRRYFAVKDEGLVRWSVVFAVISTRVRVRWRKKEERERGGDGEPTKRQRLTPRRARPSYYLVGRQSAERVSTMGKSRCRQGWC